MPENQTKGPCEQKIKEGVAIILYYGGKPHGWKPSAGKTQRRVLGKYCISAEVARRYAEEQSLLRECWNRELISKEAHVSDLQSPIPHGEEVVAGVEESKIVEGFLIVDIKICSENGEPVGRLIKEEKIPAGKGFRIEHVLSESKIRLFDGRQAE